MDISIIIVNFNGLSVLKDCLASLAQFQGTRNSEIIIVDNASEDGSVSFLKKEHKQVTVIENSTNTGFGHACNVGAEHAHRANLLFLNPDTLIQEDILPPLENFLRDHPDAGIVGPKFIHSDGMCQLSCGKLPTISREAIDKVVYFLDRRRFPPVVRWVAEKHSRATEVEWVTGAALLIRAEVFRSLGGFDTAMFMYFEDKDLCKRAREKGWKVWFVPGATVLHHLGASSESASAVRLREIYRTSQKYYYRKHHRRLQQTLLALYQRVSG